MADLMKDKHTFDELNKQYGGFMVPAFKVKVDGTELKTSMKIGVTNVDVTLALKSSSSASFTLTNVYDFKSQSFTSEIKSKLKLGAIITVELGYASSLTEVFYGFIHDITWEYGDSISVNVTALDLRRLMMGNKRKDYTYGKQNYSDIVKEILDSYKKLYKELDIDATTDKLQGIKQNSSDFDFIMNVACPNTKREFFCLGSTVYFRNPNEVTDPIIKLERGKGLLSFHKSTSYFNKLIRVYGHDDDKKQRIMVEKEAKSDTKMNTLVTPPAALEHQRPNISTQQEATDFVESQIAKELAKTRSGGGSCLGIPELVPGRYIEIDNLDSSINQKYYLNQVKHTFNEGGFITTFEIGGW